MRREPDVRPRQGNAGAARNADFDAAIAAHAFTLDATLVTASLDHMIRVPGLRVEDWSGLQPVVKVRRRTEGGEAPR